MNKLLLCLLAFSLALSACGQIGLDGQVISPTAPPTPTLVGTAGPDPDPGSSPTPVPAASATPPLAPSLLPAPLYFISARNNQIWRMERDGVTITQITREAFDIDDFDVSPVDGALVYVSNNSLYRADADGKNVLPLVSSPKVDEADFAGKWERQIRSPRWRPDGKEIWFGQAGVNFISADGQDGPHNVLPASPYPGDNAPRAVRGQTVRHDPYLFSPDGGQLLLIKYYFGEGASHALLRLNSGAPPLDLTVEGYGTDCCNAAWSQDSRSIYVGNHSLVRGLEFVGLWKADAGVGVFRPFVRGYAGDPGQPPAADASLTSIDYPFEAGGQLFAFAAIRPLAEAAQADSAALGLARVGPDGAVEIIGLEQYLTYETLGGADGSGAVLMDVAEWTYSGPYPIGRLRWLPADGGPAVDLVEIGSHLRWGR